MPRLTEVQRGQAVALLMQGQRQQQVALQFGVNVSTIERLVRRLRDTGRVADRPQRGRLRVTTPHQDKTIHLAHLRNRDVTATETALTMVGNHNRHTHPKTEKPIARVWSASSSTLHWFSSHSCTSCASYGLVGGTWSQTISNQAMETGLFHR
jgi:transposase-like protein